MRATSSKTSTIEIRFETESFPASYGFRSFDQLQTSWDDILWAAITVGRPSWFYAFRHGQASLHEALFRWSLVRMALEQRGTWTRVLRRTNAANDLDPTEKGAVNYFLGMIFCKLFASRLLNTPWMLHVDVARALIGMRLTGRSRPDLIAQDQHLKVWHAFECKGRGSTPEASAKDKAKDQAQRIVVVGGQRCHLHVGAITYFKKDVLHYYWKDPPPSEEESFSVPLHDEYWRYYWAPVLGLLRTDQEGFAPATTEGGMIRIEQADISVGVHPAVMQALVKAQWNRARDIARELFASQSGRVPDQIPYQPDGIAIVAGSTWHMPFEERAE